MCCGYFSFKRGNIAFRLRNLKVDCLYTAFLRSSRYRLLCRMPPWLCQRHFYNLRAYRLLKIHQKVARTSPCLDSVAHRDIDGAYLDACRRREFFGACGLNRPLCIKCRLYISDRGCLHLIFGSRLRLEGLIEKRCHKRNYNYRN